MMDSTASIEVIKPAEFENVIVNTTVQDQTVAFYTDSRWLKIAHYQVLKAAKAAGISLRQPLADEGKSLRRHAGGYAHANQFKHLRRILRRQRTVLGTVMREERRKMSKLDPQRAAVIRLEAVLKRAQTLRTQLPKVKKKVYAMHTPKVECIGRGKAEQAYEFGVNTSIAVTYRGGWVVAARTFPGTPSDGRIFAA